jgi:hypothetical protein
LTDSEKGVARVEVVALEALATRDTRADLKKYLKKSLNSQLCEGPATECPSFLLSFVTRWAVTTRVVCFTLKSVDLHPEKCKVDGFSRDKNLNFCGRIPQLARPSMTGISYVSQHELQISADMNILNPSLQGKMLSVFHAK